MVRLLENSVGQCPPLSGIPAGGAGAKQFIFKTAQKSEYRDRTERMIGKLLVRRATQGVALGFLIRGDLGPLSAIYLILKQMADRPLAAINGQLILLCS